MIAAVVLEFTHYTAVPLVTGVTAAISRLRTRTVAGLRAGRHARTSQPKRPSLLPRPLRGFGRCEAFDDARLRALTVLDHEPGAGDKRNGAAGLMVAGQPQGEPFE